MKIYIDDRNITDDIELLTCVHEMYAAGRADKIRMDFRTGLYKEIYRGNTVSLEDGTAKTGTMFTSSISQKHGIWSFRALSAPSQFFGTKTKSWNGVHLLQAANEIAKRNNLRLRNIACENYLYPHLQQELCSDSSFLQRICEAEGYQLIVYDGELVLYNEHYVENQPAKKKIVIPKENCIFHDNSPRICGCCEVSAGTYKGVFAPGSTGLILRPELTVNICDEAQANRYARAMLRRYNKNCFTGSFENKLLPDIAPGSVINLKLSDNSWNGDVFITYVRHDYLNRKSNISFRKILEAY